MVSFILGRPTYTGSILCLEGAPSKAEHAHVQLITPVERGSTLTVLQAGVSRKQEGNLILSPSGQSRFHQHE